MYSDYSCGERMHETRSSDTMRPEIFQPLMRLSCTNAVKNIDNGIGIDTPAFSHIIYFLVEIAATIILCLTALVP
jgi:hypothetical protein